jgi:hypothetical protein
MKYLALATVFDLSINAGLPDSQVYALIKHLPGVTTDFITPRTMIDVREHTLIQSVCHE